MNPFRLIKIYRRASKLAGLLEDAQMKKALWRSKTFWFQVLSAAAALSGAIPMPPELLAIIVAVTNVGLRIVTSEPVSVT